MSVEKLAALFELEPQQLRLFKQMAASQRLLCRELRSLRIESGISLEQMAVRLNVTSAELEAFESGEIDPQLSFVAEYAGGLGKVINIHVEDPQASVDESFTSVAEKRV